MFFVCFFRCLVVFGGSWWFFVGSLVLLPGSFWFLVIIGHNWQFLFVIIGSWWFLVSFWWVWVFLGGSLLFFDVLDCS